jgi:hypothetical protein
LIPVNPLSPVPLREPMLDQQLRVVGQVWAKYFLREHQAALTAEEVEIIAAFLGDTQPDNTAGAVSEALGLIDTGNGTQAAGIASEALIVASEALGAAKTGNDAAQVAEVLGAFAIDATVQRPVFVGTHAERLTAPAGAYPVGTRFWETDRTSMYLVQIVASAAVWRWIGGRMFDTYANRPTDLGMNDAGFLFHATDYSHTLMWGGAAWGPSWGPNDDGSDYYRLYENAPAGFGASAWQLCNGATVDRLNADGTVTSVTVPNVTTALYLKGGIVSAAAAPAGGSTGSATTGLPTATFTPDAGGDAAYVPPDPGHTHSAGSIELANLQKRLYFRR